MFRVTRDMASTLAMDSQPTGGLVVNSVGDILRHEKLRRLKKVSRLFFFSDLLCGFHFVLLLKEVAMVEARRAYHHLVWLLVE